MVTIAAAIVMLAHAGPATARRSTPSPWGDLLGDHPPKLRGGIQHRAAVPLPRPRPAEAPAAETEKPKAEKPQQQDTGKAAEKAAEQASPAPQPSACRQALTEEIAIAPSIPDIHGPGDCGGEDLVRLEAIVLPDRRRVEVKPAAILRCKMATAVADWVRTDIAPLAQNLGSALSDLDNFELVRMPRPQPRHRCATVGAWPRQCARCPRLQARRRPRDRADRPRGVARLARDRAAFGVRSVLDRARAGLGRVP